MDIDRRMGRGLLNAEDRSARSPVLIGESTIAIYNHGGNPPSSLVRRRRHIDEIVSYDMRKACQHEAEEPVNTPVSPTSRSSASEDRGGVGGAERYMQTLAITPPALEQRSRNLAACETPRWAA